MPLVEGTIQWEGFRKPLKRAYNKERIQERRAQSFDADLIFMVPMLQYFCDLSDGQTENQSCDHYSHCLFPALSAVDGVKDTKSILLFHERFKRLALVDKLFPELLGQIST